jgi:hypothetical protein
VLAHNRHTGTNFYDAQRIQVKREEGYQLVCGRFGLLITILVGTKIKFEVAENELKMSN